MKPQDLIISDDLDNFSPEVFGNRRCILIMRCLTGELRLVRHSYTYIIKQDDLLICLSDYLLGHYMRTADFTCRFYACPQHELAKHAYRCLRVEPDWWEKINYMLHNPLIHLNDVQKRFALLFHHSLIFYKQRFDTAYQSEMLDLLADLAIYELLTHINKQIIPALNTTISVSVHSKDELLKRFTRLIQEHSSQQREVQWYASKLAITPKYLSSFVHQLTGKKAYDLINSAAIEYVKSELTDTTDDIKQIANRMNFSSVSFFCKYVQRYLGMTPLEYRRKYSY